MGMQMMQSASQGAYLLRGAFQQATERDFLYDVPTRLIYPQSGLSVAAESGTGAVSPADPTIQFQKGLETSAFRVNNRSAATGVLGYGYCWRNAPWRTFTWDDSAASSYAEDLAGQSRSAFTLFAAAGEGANDGWGIVSERQFNWVSVNVTTATVGATTFAVRYSNAAGTGWTNMVANTPLVDGMTISASVVPAGEQRFVWNPPSNWGKVVSLENLPVGMYAWQVFIDAATITTAGVATGIEIGSMYSSAEAIADNASFAEDNISFVDYDAIGVVALIPAAVIGSNVDFYTHPAG